jgi:sulfite exporter TauE/SafE
VFATYGAELLSASVWRGALIGGVFGFGRSLALLLAGRIDRPSRLSDFHRQMADLGLPVRRGAALSFAAAGILGSVGALL